MKYKKIDNTYVLRLEVGEEITDTIKAFCKAEGVSAGSVQGIGAADKVSVGYYSLEDKKYYSKVFEKQLEIVSLLGNITVRDNEPYLHVHASFSDEDYSIIAGHLNSAVVSVTAEIFITVHDGVINRIINNKTGLTVIDV